jgi:hypothetical protein
VLRLFRPESGNNDRPSALVHMRVKVPKILRSLSARTGSGALMRAGGRRGESTI